MADAAAWAVSHPGLVRAGNEDRCYVGRWRSAPEVDRWQGRLGKDELHAAIADGMGGHRRGEVASGIAIGCVSAMVPSILDDSHVPAMLDAANLRVFDAMQGPDGWPAMGTTIAGAIIRDELGLAYNIGDSRVYVLAGSELLQISRDHVPATPPLQGRSHALTQSLGGTRMRMHLAPHVVRFDPRRVDAVLLCSDGLSDMVANEQIAALLRDAAEDPVDALLNAALSAGGRDNVTIVLIRLRRPSAD